MSHLETVRKIYERFARGDVPTILGTFTEDIEFRLAQGHPYKPDGKPWIGARAITENFFAKVGPEWQDWTFHIDAAVEALDALVVEGRYAAVYKPTARPLDAQACHVWRFRDGRIASFHQYVDTAHVQDVMRPPRVDPHPFVMGVHGTRYQVKDVARSTAFYTQHLGFEVAHQQLPAFASVVLGDTQILLSGPGASGSRPMPDGKSQEPGGWNRVVLRVEDLPRFIAALRRAGVGFRNEMEVGPGGRQVQIEDPDGNPIELFEPAAR